MKRSTSIRTENLIGALKLRKSAARTGMRCPDCGESESFEIQATTPALIRFSDGGQHEIEDIEIDAKAVKWTRASACECMVCRRAGTVADFLEVLKPGGMR